MGYEASIVKQKSFIPNNPIYEIPNNNMKSDLIWCLNILFIIQKMISKSIKEVGKLYPEDFDDKVVTRHDLELVIMMKKKEIDHF